MSKHSFQTRDSGGCLGTENDEIGNIYYGSTGDETVCEVQKMITWQITLVILEGKWRTLNKKKYVQKDEDEMEIKPDHARVEIELQQCIKIG